MCRVFGDGSMKPPISNIPSYFTFDLEDKEEEMNKEDGDKYLLIGSDGFFDVMK